MLSVIHCNQVLDIIEYLLPDAFYFQQFVDVFETAVINAVYDDGIRPGIADTRKGLQQPGFGTVDVDFLGAFLSFVDYQLQLAALFPAFDASGGFDKGFYAVGIFKGIKTGIADAAPDVDIFGNAFCGGVYQGNHYCLSAAASYKTKKIENN
jgi:hypothetical protein